MKSRIFRIIAGRSTPVPISENRFRTFTKNTVLTNSTLTVYKNVIESPQNTFLQSIWAIVEECLQFKSHFLNVSDINYSEVFERPYSDDFYLAAVGDIEGRKQKIIMPFFSNWFEMYVKHQGREETSAFYYNNFPMKAWIMELCMLVVLLLIFWVACYVCQKFFLNKKQLGFSDCTLQIISFITNQGGSPETISISMRILTLTVMLFGFLITATYASLLIASQSVSIAAPTLATLDDVKRIRSHQLCVRNGSWAHDSFRVDPENDTSDIAPEWRDLINGPGCPKDPDDLEATCHNKIVSFVLFRHFTHDNGLSFKDCLVVPLKETLYREVGIISVGNMFNIGHKRSIEQVFNKLRNVGILQYWWYKSRTYIPPVQPPTSEKPEVSIGHVTGLLRLYLVCTFLAFLILGIEILVNKNQSIGNENNSGPNSLPYID